MFSSLFCFDLFCWGESFVGFSICLMTLDIFTIAYCNSGTPSRGRNPLTNLWKPEDLSTKGFKFHLYLVMKDRRCPLGISDLSITSVSGTTVPMVHIPSHLGGRAFLA